MKILLVFAGGGLGSVFRYLMSIYMVSGTGLPYATIVANFCASFLLGMSSLFLAKSDNDTLKYILAIGFCGGFSTFSTFSLENYNFLKDQAYFLMMLNIFLNLMLCLAGVFLGINLAKQI